jgi:hypothetical protein
VAIHKNKLWALFYDGSEVEVVTTSFDARKVADPVVTRVPATAFSASALGDAFKCVVQVEQLSYYYQAGGYKEMSSILSDQ